MQWCAHCQTLAPNFDAAASRLKGIIAFGKLDCTVHEEIAQRYGIHSYPTVLAFRPGAAKDAPIELDIGDGLVDDLMNAALEELSKVVLQRTREEKAENHKRTGTGSVPLDEEVDTCTKQTDPQTGAEFEVCLSDKRRGTDDGSSPRVIQPRAESKLPNSIDVAIVGGGPAGLGAAIALKDAGVGNYVVLERGVIGETFYRWPKEMRFITPSFYSNVFKVPDLNAINPHSSPAFVLNREHPTGEQYATYLDIVAEYYQLPVYEDEEVISIQTSSIDMPSAFDSNTNATFSGFKLQTAKGQSIFARYVLWAGGEFQFPNRPEKLQGSELGIHASTIGSWKDYTHKVGPNSADLKTMLVVGGYESGIDAAVNLAEQGVQHVYVFDKGAPWANREGDPSEILSPRTIERLEYTISAAEEPNSKVGQIHLVQQHATSIARNRATLDNGDDDVDGVASSSFDITVTDGQVFSSYSPPVLATGFKVCI